MTRVFVAAATALALTATSAAAQTSINTPDATAVAPTSDACTYPMGSGAFKVCFNANGNLVQLESPAAAEHIRVGGTAEGYGVCAASGYYYDIAAAASGWGTPTLLNLTSTSVKISRTTLDGEFSLEQTWKLDKNERDLTVTMTLRNLGGPKVGVMLYRAADLDVDNDLLDDIYDRGVSSVWVRDQRAVTLGTLSPTISHSTAITNAFTPPNCTPASLATPAGPSDVLGLVTMNLGGFNSNQAKTVKFTYKVQ